MRVRMGLKPAFYTYSWGINAPREAETETQVTELQVACGRRDSAALQVVVAGDDDFLLTTSTDPVFWKGGALPICRISAELSAGLALEVSLIGLVADNDRLLKSDPLLAQSAIFVERRRLQQVWVECHAAANTPPGTYQGAIRLYARTLCEDEVLIGECTFTVVVKDLLLPVPRDYHFYLDIFQHPSSIARHYQVPLWSDDYFRLLIPYLESLAQLGQKAASVFVSEIPYVGQHSHRLRQPSDVFEYSMIAVRRTPDGRFSYDFSALDRYVDAAWQQGITENIDVFGLLSVWQDQDAGYGPIVDGYPDAMRVRYLDEESGTYRFMHDLGDLEAYIRALEAHFIEQGWADCVRVIADEPADIAVFERQMATLQRLAPSFRCRVAINHVEFIQQSLQGVADYVPILNGVADEFERLMALRETVAGRILYYVCWWQEQPNSFIGSPALECRVLPWLVERLRLDGFLRWAFTAWVDRPFDDLAYREWPFGDMLFVYPGASGAPVLSLRYKWLQRGIRDYEVMQLLKERGEGARVARVLDGVFRFQTPRDLNPAAHKVNTDLYSLDQAHYDRLIAEL